MQEVLLIWEALNPLERIGLISIVVSGIAAYIGWVEFVGWLDARFRTARRG